MKTFPLPFQLFDQAIEFYETTCKNNNLPYTAPASELTRTEKTKVILSNNCSELARLQYDRNYFYFAANGTTLKHKIEYS